MTVFRTLPVVRLFVSNEFSPEGYTIRRILHERGLLSAYRVVVIDDAFGYFSRTPSKRLVKLVPKPETKPNDLVKNVRRPVDNRINGKSV